MNSYYDASMLNSTNTHPNLGSSRMLGPQSGTPMNPPGGFQPQQVPQQQFSPGLYRMPPPVRANAPVTQASAINPENLSSLLDKPINELTVADIIQINLISNEPIRQQLSILENDFKKKFQSIEDRMNILDSEKSKIEEENIALKNVVVNMQKSLNRIDSGVRMKNVIITGLPEGEIQSDDGNNTYSTDKQKIKCLLARMDNHAFDDQIEELDISRIGVEKAGYNRVIKIILPTVEKRDEFLKNTSKMKDAPSPWNKVFIKKDQHPVYIAENNRLRTKANELKKKPGYENKEVKIFNGKVLVDNVVVDKNMFFH